MPLLIHRLYPGVPLPTRAYEESAAWDLSAFERNSYGQPKTLTIAPQSVRLIGTGLAIRPPPGHLVLVCSRSGLAVRGVFVANAPGVVDPDYTGEIKVALYNGSSEPHFVKHGDRIAQALVVGFLTCEIQETESFPPTSRGTKAFGSSGE